MPDLSQLIGRRQKVGGRRQEAEGRRQGQEVALHYLHAIMSLR